MSLLKRIGVKERLSEEKENRASIISIQVPGSSTVQTNFCADCMTQQVTEDLCVINSNNITSSDGGHRAVLPPMLVTIKIMKPEGLVRKRA